MAINNKIRNRGRLSVDCPDGAIADCDGNCFPEYWFYTYQGDGWCDDRTLDPINLACAEFDCDSGDCRDCFGECLGPAVDLGCGCNEPGPGDLNGDGGFNVQDVIILTNCVMADNCSDAEDGGCAADTNVDGGWNIMDIVSLANCVLTNSCAGINGNSEYDLYEGVYAPPPGLNAVDQKRILERVLSIAQNANPYDKQKQGEILNILEREVPGRKTRPVRKQTGGRTQPVSRRGGRVRPKAVRRQTGGRGGAPKPWNR